MSRTYDNEKKPSQSTFSFKPTASFLQTRGFAPLQTDLDEDDTPRPSGYTENFLEKISNYSGWRFGKKWFPRNTCLRDARTLTPCFLRVEI